MDLHFDSKINLDNLQTISMENKYPRKYGFSSLIIVGLIGVSMILSKSLPIILSDVILPYFIETEPQIMTNFMYPILSEISLIIIPCFAMKFYQSSVTIYDFANSVPNNYFKAIASIFCFSMMSFALISNEKCGDNSLESLNTIVDFFLYLFSNCFFPAFCEEFVFRGWTFHFLSENMIKPLDVITTSILFTFCHSHRSLFSYFLIFILSILWNYANITTESLFVSIFSHFFHNFLHSIFLLLYSPVCDLSPSCFFALWISSCFLLLFLIDF